MREIIYRCWDNLNKEFAYSNEQKDYAKFVFENNTLVCYFGEDYGEDFRWVKAKNTPEEYTSLKDMKGTKVFENDIVRFRHFNDEKIGKVKFNGGMGCMEMGVTSSDGHYNSYLLGHCERMEIIGNIHDKY